MTPLNHHTNLPPTSQLLGCGGEINFRLVEVPAPGDCCHTRWHLTVPDSPLFPSASSSSATLHSPSPLLNTFVPSPHVPLHLLPFFWRTLLQSHRPFSLTAWGWGRGGSFPSIFIHTPHPPTPDPQPPPHHPRSVWSRYPASPGSRSEEQTLQRHTPPPSLQTRRCEGPRQWGRHYRRHPPSSPLDHRARKSILQLHLSVLPALTESSLPNNLKSNLYYPELLAYSLFPEQKNYFPTSLCLFSLFPPPGMPFQIPENPPISPSPLGALPT